MAAYKRDVEELKRAIGAHRIAGYPVTVPIFGDAFAVSSSTTIAPTGGFTGVLVRPAKPMPFEILADIMKWDSVQMNLPAWLRYFKERRGMTQGSGMSTIPAEIQERLERGEIASMRDVQEFYLMAWGCLDLDRNITCYSFPLTSVEIPQAKLRPGMLVEFYDHISGKTDWMGRVAGFDTDPEDGSQVVLVELFEPTPYLSLPKASSPRVIRPGFYSSNTWVLGKDVAAEMQKAGIPLPAGRWDVEDPAERRRLYYLENPVPITDLEAFCKSCPDCIGDTEEIKACTRNSMIMYVAPIHPREHTNSRMHRGGVFRPLPEDVLEGVETEVVGLED